ncbi:MAG: ATP-binding protein [Ignavibacteriaceae bacterium]|nr:ATP-binding protein [Ignavibacteriaceae bacterium]
MIKRYLEDVIPKFMFRNKAVIIFGPRQAGKTTLVKKITEKTAEKTLYISGDDLGVRNALIPSKEKLAGLTAGYKILVIDEAQKIDDIGNIIKIFTDQISEVQVIATGSSAFELMSKTSESLTGRKFEFMLYPLSFAELVENSNLIAEKGRIEERLVMGAYPEVVSIPEFSGRTLKSLATDYLFKDVFSMDGIRYPSVIDKLVRALAFQVGSEVSNSELSRLTGADNKTIEKYLRILELAYIVFRLPAFSRNERNEIKKGKKYYFYDNGIRNALIGNLSDLTTRTDSGALWENYVISERKKYLSYSENPARSFFWRTLQQQEIDYVEETYEGVRAYEFKWNEKAKVRFPETFVKSYKPLSLKSVNRQNFEEFLIPERFGSQL